MIAPVSPSLSPHPTPFFGSPDNLDLADVLRPAANQQQVYYATNHVHHPPNMAVQDGGVATGEELMTMKTMIAVNHTTTPLHMNQIVVTNLADSPRNSRSSFTVPTDIGRSLKNLQPYKDLFVSRKRIAIGPAIKEGGCG